MVEDNILDEVLAEFEKIAAIPRPSGHEKKVSDFLKEHLTALGFSVAQDANNNLIADLSATAGFENAPRVALQGHIDMVCVADDGKNFSPTTDAIKLVRGKNYLSADGTSLGADNGAGIAMAICAAKRAKRHGPLRIILTVDEERGMTGAISLDEKYLRDVDFFINCDSETFDEIVVGSAGGVHIKFSRKLTRVPAVGKHAWRIEAVNLRGGHSGECIGLNRGNAIKALAFAAEQIAAKGAFRIVSIDGGTVENAIPDFAAMEIVTDIDEKDIADALKNYEATFKAIHGDADPDAKFLSKAIPLPAVVMEGSDAENTLRLLRLLPSGVAAISPTATPPVETSANVGVIKTDGDRLTVKYYPRSAIDEKLCEIAATSRELAAITGFEAICAEPSPAWKENKNSRLAGIMKNIFRELNGRDMKTTVIHAGLECGYFFRKNPKLDIVSIGPTTEDIHSPRERLLLETVAPQTMLIVRTIEAAAENMEETQ